MNENLNPNGPDMTSVVRGEDGQWCFHVIGTGEGCDYTVGCNEKTEFEFFPNANAARNHAEALFRHYGGSERVDRVTYHLCATHPQTICRD